MRKKRKILFGSIVVLLLLAVLAKSKGWIGKKDVVEVSVAEVVKRDITESVSANGKIQPEVEVKISSDVSGEIVSLLVTEGEKVQKGQLLCKINPDIYQASLNRAEASINNAKANLANARARLAQVKAQAKAIESNYSRIQSLYKTEAVAASEYEQALSDYEGSLAEIEAAQEQVKAGEYTVESSRATLKEATDNLKRTSIYAPMDGTVSALMIEQGERVVGTAQMAGTEIMRIADLKNMEVNVEVNENDIVRVSLGDTAAIEVDAYLERDFLGVVTEIANSAITTGESVDQVTNFSVKIRILRSSYEDLIAEGKSHLSPFRPGMSATVEIKTETARNVLSVPIEAVTLRDDTSSTKKSYRQRRAEKQSHVEREPLNLECVFVFEKGKARLVPVEVGVQDNRFIHIKKGLSGEEQVITGPYEVLSRKLFNGNEVEEAEDEELFSGNEGE